MGIFKKIIKTGIHTVTSPVEAVKDIATLGGVLTDEDEAYSVKRFKKIMEDLDELEDEIDDL